MLLLQEKFRRKKSIILLIPLTQRGKWACNEELFSRSLINKVPKQELEEHMPISAAIVFLAIAPTLARPATPVVNPATWVTTADYPTDALREKVEGRVGFELAIDTQGRPTRCTIKSSSGSPSLDETTCSLLTRRARFTPATDKRGRPTTGTYSNSVRWVIPTMEPVLAMLTRAKLAFAKGERTVTYTIKTDGTVSDCSVTGDFGAGTLLREIDGRPAPQLPGSVFCPVSQVRFVPLTDKDGKPVERRVREVHRFEIVTD